MNDLIKQLLGRPLQQITRSYWAVKLNNGTWISEARTHIDLYKGIERPYDWSNDLVANGDVAKIRELWLLCPPSTTSPLGNTARLDISEPYTAFQLKVGTVDSNLTASSRTVQAHIIGKVINKENGDCECYIWDYMQDGLITPNTLIYDPLAKDHIERDEKGRPIYAGRTNVYHFHSWRGAIAPLGLLELGTLGVRL